MHLKSCLHQTKRSQFGSHTQFLHYSGSKLHGFLCSFDSYLMTSTVCTFFLLDTYLLKYYPLIASSMFASSSCLQEFCLDQRYSFQTSCVVLFIYFVGLFLFYSIQNALANLVPDDAILIFHPTASFLDFLGMLPVCC